MTRVGPVLPAKTRVVQVRMTERELKLLRVVAFQRGLTVSDFIRGAIAREAAKK